jgi:hypothetical protein
MLAAARRSGQITGWQNDKWLVEEVTSPASTVCEDIAAHAPDTDTDGEPDTGPTLDELSRISALVGASEALPHRTDAPTAVEADESPALALGQAAAAIDAASFAECKIPVFTALYLSTSFSSCHVRVALPVAGLSPATAGCGPTA